MKSMQWALKKSACRNLVIDLFAIDINVKTKAVAA